MNSMKKNDLTSAYNKMLKAASMKMEELESDDEAVVEVVKAGHKISSEDISIEEVAKVTTKNAEELFGI